jgi:hypothetical protein
VADWPNAAQTRRGTRVEVERFRVRRGRRHFALARPGRVFVQRHRTSRDVDFAKPGLRIGSPELFSQLQSEAATQAGAEACE